jgi:AcrR family transcriptional regulator
MTNRQKQAIRTKNKIFDTTISLISEHGFDNVNIEDICKTADVSVGTFYNYYKSKNEVFFEIYSRADHYFEETVKDKLSKSSSSEIILEYFDYYSLYCVKTGVSTLTQMMNASNRNFTKRGRYMQLLLTELLENEIAAGKLKTERTAAELCDYYFMIARGILFDWCLHEGAYDLKARMRECLSSINF